MSTPEQSKWRLANAEDEPRWTIAKWDSERCFIEGPVILPADDGLAGLEWVEAATVEVVPLVYLEGLAEAANSLHDAIKTLRTVLQDNGIKL